jgi:plasmid stabilization system protein ParE
MRYRVLIHPDAEKELREAYDWLCEESPTAAERWRKGLLRKVRSLASFPERCPIAPEAEKLGEDMRQLLYGRRQSSRYRLLFIVEGSTVTVLHVRHGARHRLGEES